VYVWCVTIDCVWIGYRIYCPHLYK
jgi:hypothetical protein